MVYIICRIVEVDQYCIPYKTPHVIIILYDRRVSYDYAQHLQQGDLLMKKTFPKKTVLFILFPLLPIAITVVSFLPLIPDLEKFKTILVILLTLFSFVLTIILTCNLFRHSKRPIWIKVILFVVVSLFVISCQFLFTGFMSIISEKGSLVLSTCTLADTKEFPNQKRTLYIYEDRGFKEPCKVLLYYRKGNSPFMKRFSYTSNNYQYNTFLRTEAGDIHYRTTNSTVTIVVNGASYDIP